MEQRFSESKNRYKSIALFIQENKLKYMLTLMFDLTNIVQYRVNFFHILTMTIIVNKKQKNSLKKMKNPWEELEGISANSNFVLPNEKKVIDEFNLNSIDLYKIHTEIMPAPFMGNVHTAPIVILMLNPGYDSKEEKNGYYEEYREYWQKEILHLKSIPNLPLFCLDER